MEPACAKACPTDSIQFGELDELRERAERASRRAPRRAAQATRGCTWRDADDGVGGSGAFFLLLDEPEVYGLPPDPVVTTRDLADVEWGRSGAGACGAIAVAASRRRRRAQSETRRQRRHGRVCEPLLLRPAGIKAPVWKREIPCTSSSAGSPARPRASPARRAARQRGLARALRRSRAALAVSPALLITDLGRPSAFLNMLRVFKVTSPMSVGSWVLAAGGATRRVSRSAADRARPPGRSSRKPGAAALGLPVSRIPPY